MPQMRAVSLSLLDRAQTGAAGSIPLAKETQEAVNQVSKLEVEIATLEAMEGGSESDLVQKKLKELAKLQPKLPRSTQLLSDHAQVLDTLREIEDKRSQ